MALHDYRVIEGESIKQFPRWNGTRWRYPHSHLLLEDLRPALRPLIPEDGNYWRVSDRYEYRVALLQHNLQDIPGACRGAPGEFIGEGQWTHDGVPLMEIDFKATAEQADEQWPWRKILGGTDATTVDEALADFRADLAVVRRG